MAVAATGGRPVLIDPRGHRFGAGVSAALLAAGWWSDSRWLVLIAGASLAVSALLGLRYSVYGWAWRGISRTARLPAVALEPEYGPRFAQTVGSVVLGVAVVLFALGQGTAGWALVLAVFALQALLAVTGFCLGCRLYFLNWWIPRLVTRWWRRSWTN